MPVITGKRSKAAISSGKQLKRRKASSPPATAEEHPQTNYSPACPGVVKPRQQGRLSKLPSGTDAFTAFAQVRVDKDLSDEEAFLRLLSTYDVPLRSLSQIFGNSPIVLNKLVMYSLELS
jgi:hypothetical protein